MATLSVNEIMQDTLEAFKTTLGPIINSWTTDFSSATAVLNDTITAHIRSVPSSSTYDATTGYKNGAAEADATLTDVPVILNTHAHVPIKVDYLTQLASKKNLYKEAVAEQGFALAKKIVDDALALVVAANFTHTSTESIANTNYDTLETVRNALNAQKAANLGRFGIVNSSFAGALCVDNRIISGDYFGQRNGGTGWRTWQNIAGFQNIWEYPDLPSTGNLSAFFGDRRAIIIASRLPSDNVALPDLPQVDRTYPVTDPETGLSLLGIAWREAGTRDVYFTVASLYGLKAGAQGGAADAITDNAGHWVKTS